MPNAILVKSAGLDTVIQILRRCAEYEYPVEAAGASANFGTDDDELAIHFTGSPNLTEANNMLTAIALPTCTASLLDITVNVGTLVVADETSITADPVEIKTVKASILIDDVTGVLEVHAFKKTTGEYGAVPGGKTFCANLKEYTVPGAGTVLTEINDFIE